MPIYERDKKLLAEGNRATLDDCGINNQQLIEIIIPLLIGNPSLESLSLERNNIGNDGALKLCEALATTERSTPLRLSLSYNNVDKSGLEALMRNKNIILVGFTNNYYTPSAEEKKRMQEKMKAQPSSITESGVGLFSRKQAVLINEASQKDSPIIGIVSPPPRQN